MGIHQSPVILWGGVKYCYLLTTASYVKKKFPRSRLVMKVVLDSRPHPKLCPISPGTVAEHSPDSNKGFNIWRNCHRKVVHDKYCMSQLLSVLGPQVLAEETSSSTPQLPAEDAASRSNVVEDACMSCTNPPEEEGGEGDCSEDSGGWLDLDLERQVLNHVVQLGLDPNDGAIHELLRHRVQALPLGLTRMDVKAIPRSTPILHQERPMTNQSWSSSQKALKAKTRSMKKMRRKRVQHLHMNSTTITGPAMPPMASK